MEDPFEKEIEDKKERVAKNEIKRLRNIARAQKVKIPGSHGLAPTLGGKEAVQNSGNELSKAADLAKKSQEIEMLHLLTLLKNQTETTE